MILTVTLNPLLERRLFYNEFEKGKVNRAKKEIFYAGGKGINVSRQLNLLEVKNTALTFIGGNNGKAFRRALEAEGTQAVFVNMKSEMRWAALAIEEDKQKVTSFFCPNPEISEHEASEFASRLERMIPNCSIVIFAGSSPHPNTDDLIAYGVKIANENDKISIVDTYGEALKLAIKNSPTVLHNNLSELRTTLGLSLANEKEKREFLSELYSNGIKMAYLTDGAKTAYASKFDFHYKLMPPKIKEIDATGSGDAFIAGVSAGLENGITFNEFSRKALALGAANAASFETCKVTKDEYSALIEQTGIVEVGKKMKLIDDSPTC
jgi:tagatose 6-phosphate kinase